MAYPEETWLKIKLDYENGRVSSTRELSEKYHISEPAINKRLQKEGWIKNQLLPATAESIQQRFAKALEKSIGIDYLINKVKELMEATDSVMIGDKELGKQKNWTAIANGLKEANKILGTYAPVKQEIDVKVEVTRYVDAVVRGLSRSLPDELKEKAIEAVYQELEGVK